VLHRKCNFSARCQWFTPVILATLEAEIGRIQAGGQPRQRVFKTPPISKITTEKWTGGVAQVYGTCFASQNCKPELNSNSSLASPKTAVSVQMLITSMPTKAKK
jgi:hypothetical protein